MTVARIGLLALAAFLGLLAAGCGDNVSVLSCQVGETTECACANGDFATQQCIDGSRFSPCACGGEDAGPTADAGSDSDGSILIGNCEDGSFDPDDVCTTEPFTGGVYLEGTVSEGSCGAFVLLQFWPTLATDEVRPFPCTPSFFHFRDADHALVYLLTGGELQLFEDGVGDPLISTPSCEGDARGPVGFDQTGRPFYLCFGGNLFAGDALVRSGMTGRYAGTLADGRSVIAEEGSHPGRLDYVVIDDAGNELARLAPHDSIDKLVPLVDAMTIDGNVAYVLFERVDATSLESVERELVSFRLDENNNFEPSRRTTVDTFGLVLSSSNLITLSDGVMFLRESDPDAPLSSLNERIRAFLPDGTRRVVWREIESPRIKASAFTRQMLQGPRAP